MLHNYTLIVVWSWRIDWTNCGPTADDETRMRPLLPRIHNKRKMSARQQPSLHTITGSMTSSTCKQCRNSNIYSDINYGGKFGHSHRTTIIITATMTSSSQIIINNKTKQANAHSPDQCPRTNAQSSPQSNVSYWHRAVGCRAQSTCPGYSTDERGRLCCRWPSVAARTLDPMSSRLSGTYPRRSGTHRPASGWICRSSVGRASASALCWACTFVIWPVARIGWHLAGDRSAGYNCRTFGFLRYIVALSTSRRPAHCFWWTNTVGRVPCYKTLNQLRVTNNRYCVSVCILDCALYSMWFLLWSGNIQNLR